MAIACDDTLCSTRQTVDFLSVFFLSVFLQTYPSACKEISRKQRKSFPFGVGRPFRLLETVDAEQPPRRVLASRRLHFAAIGVPRFDPRPEGKGAGVQNAGMRASVGRRLHWAVSGLGLRGCCVGLAITEVTAISG